MFTDASYASLPDEFSRSGVAYVNLPDGFSSSGSCTIFLSNENDIYCPVACSSTKNKF